MNSNANNNNNTADAVAHGDGTVGMPNPVPGSRFPPGYGTHNLYTLTDLVQDNGSSYGRVTVQEDVGAGAITTSVYVLVRSNDPEVADTMAHLEFCWARAQCGHGLNFETTLKGLAMRDAQVLGIGQSHACFIRGIGPGVAFHTAYGHVVVAIEWTNGVTTAHVLIPGDAKDTYLQVAPCADANFPADILCAITLRVVPHDANLDTEPSLVDMVLVAHGHDNNDDDAPAHELDDDVPDIDTASTASHGDTLLLTPTIPAADLPAAKL